jgi:tetratricopeptide (TPR) repeat protein
MDQLFHVGEYFLNTGKYFEAEEIYWRGLKLNESVLGLEHLSTLDSMNNLALVLCIQGEYNEAKTIHQRTLELRKKVLSYEHPSTLDSMNNLAVVLYS